MNANENSNNQLICQCCGMPLDESTFSKELDGTTNNEYCKWCYSNGEFKYHNMNELIEFCANNLASEEFSPEQMRAYMSDMLPKLKYWKK